jgi:hypothetical protein
VALSARVPANTDTYYFIPKIYANQVIDAAKSQLVSWDAVNTQWTSGMKKGNIFYIPKTNVVTATEVVVGTKGTALDPFNTAGVALTIDQWYEAPVDLDYMSLAQSESETVAAAAREAAYAIAKRMDTTINALFSALGGTTYPNSDGDTLTDDVLLDLKETLDEADVPLDGQRFLILDPSALVDMMKIDKFISAQYTNIGAVSNGVIGNSPIYGCQVRVTNNLTASTTGAFGCMLHKNAIAGKAQIDKTWVKEFEELHETRVHCEALYGAIEAQDTFGKAFYTRKK